MQAMTQSTNLVLEALRMLPAVGGLGVVTGPNGSGKTTAICMAMDDLPQVRRIEPTPAPSGSSPRAFFREVALRLGMQVSNSHGATDLALAIESEVKSRGLLLVIDACGQMPRSWLPCTRYLADTLGALCLVGAETFRSRIEADPGLAVRCRIPVQMKVPTLMEVAKHYGEEWDQTWIAAAHETVEGRWGQLATVVAMARMRCTAQGAPTRSATADDARKVAEAFLLRVAA